MNYKYTLWCAPDDNIIPLQTHFAQYAIDARFKASVIMSDGGLSDCAGFPGFTLLGMTGNLAMAYPVALFTPGGVVLIVAGAIIDHLIMSRIKNLETPPPYPVAKFVEVTFCNVSAQRINWTEYLLCKMAAAHNWQILTTLRDPKNAKYAALNTKAPTPWGKRTIDKKSILRSLWNLF